MIDRNQALALVEALTGAPPYRWQARLLEDWLAQGRTPLAVDVPTGLGKTRVMALWLAARALGAALPRRLVYVVDRRAVVDQASREAERLAQALPSALSRLGEAEAHRCWARLGMAAGGDLPVSTLRGRYRDNRRWLDAPGACAIIVGTVDMIGSRLLFEGYGVGRGIRPAHAGLLGADALALIDEAHLAAPFEALMRSVAAEPRPAPVPPLRVMALSATGAAAATTGAAVFRLDDADAEDPAVKRRLDAPKRLALHETTDLVKAMVERALALAEGGRRVAVFCNQRDKGAREIERRLREEAARIWPGQPVTTLLVGARRGLEREPDAVLRRFLPDEAPAPGTTPAFLVATSAGEVGIDLDADHMVCDLVAWERMVQRLGRVNRTGRSDPAQVDVFWTAAPAKAVREDAEDEVDDRLAALRAPFESDASIKDASDGRRAAGPAALAALKRNAAFAALAQNATTPEPLRPALTRALCDAWAMTSLEHHPGRPNIEPWLRGWVETRPQAQVIWRRILPAYPHEEPDDALLEDVFSQLPPHLTEVVETDASLIATTVKTRAADVLKRLAGDEQRALKTLAAVLLSPRNEVEKRFGLEALANTDTKRMQGDLAGCTLVLDSRLGGLSASGLLDPSEAAAPTTLDAERPPPEGASGWTEERLAQVGRRLRTVDADAPPLDGWVRQAGWPCSRADEDAEDEATGREWRVEHRPNAAETGDPASARADQTLHDHLGDIVEEAGWIADRLGLPPDLRAVLLASATGHDLGKARENWQRYAGNPGFVRGLRPALAKFAHGGDWRLLAERPGETRLYRHEFGSLRDALRPELIQALPEALRLYAVADLPTPELQDLALHLIASHHGYARPVITPYDPEQPPAASDARAQAAALRFARLQRRWGPWGLAWWEALLRAADRAASRRPPSAETR